ncbi:alkyl sulfatase dimerization domain-containing protein [Sphingobium baderi]|uniref:alkyl sulfatase dimerization domain-containing protein n=1 Tax=Sphingobium baderi TaxID=1332080 RepID=UPI002B4064A4|nr:alkyl sulfatase dimerization domain-containing protein [Sphingobium baderi]WRD75817.1 alkyl sulfatase dimerization domain-containing protein [Sphingobium baderi]
MTRYRTLDHIVLPIIAWDPGRPAEWVNDHIAMVHATSNAYVIAGDEGDVVVNSGTAAQGLRVREKFETLLGRALNPVKIVFTQSHPDHVGGWQAFAGPQAEMICQQMFHQICAERRMLGPFFGPRNANVLAAMTPPGAPTHNWFDMLDPEPLTTFADALGFTCSGRRYQLISLPSGETLDALALWLPDERTLFTGNWAGAIHGALPNFYTARGDRDRSIPRWLQDCDRLLALEPDLLITGHEQPIAGANRIRHDLGKVRDAVQFIHDETVKGMVKGDSLPDILAALVLPENLAPRDGRCPPHWIARSVWEEYAGWFRQERTSELYPTPASAIWPELVEMAGGAAALATRAQAHLAGGADEKALHFIEMAVAVEPNNKMAREAELAIHDALADRTEGRIFDLLGWLEGRMIAARASIAEGKGPTS